MGEGEGEVVHLVPCVVEFQQSTEADTLQGIRATLGGLLSAH